MPNPAMALTACLFDEVGVLDTNSARDTHSSADPGMALQTRSVIDGGDLWHHAKHRAQCTALQRYSVRQYAQTPRRHVADDALHRRVGAVDCESRIRLHGMAGGAQVVCSGERSQTGGQCNPYNDEDQ
ncbi:MAG: hypothetical protein CVT67_01620 [Actinobacteria bacterium HGW-Actinobacteria-7]|jgi:hypothetical protein|nr:MAG: hypothetical protein CVT67_01620 [Actinobacteria bacterium HGW-Actinobacteria-7]